MTTMIMDLPEDLIEQIFSRIPLKSIEAVRLTCKTWNNLSKSDGFAKMHVGKVKREGENMMIMIRNHKLSLISIVVDDVDPCIELKGQVSFLSPRITFFVHYEGLLLFLKDDTRIRILVVWNPYLGQTRWIKLRFYHLIWSVYAVGYEDKKSCRNVKLLRFIDYFNRNPQFFWYEIYDFDSGLWKTLDVTPHWRIYSSFRSVTLKGNTYWYAKKRNSDFKGHIICFDFTRERFGPLLPLPSSVMDLEYGYPFVTLSCFREENLAALFQQFRSRENELEIWITTKIDVETVSWSKFLRMDSGPEIGYPMSYCIDEEKKVFMDFHKDYSSGYRKLCTNIIGEAGYVKRKDLGVPGDRSLNHVGSYVPSLVQIKKPARGKRIKQSRLEKCLFDQNKSRLDAFENSTTNIRSLKQRQYGMS